MAAVVNATCPGCKKVLRIPEEWVKQAIRCKHCGTVLKPKKTPAKEPPAKPKAAAALPPVRNGKTERPAAPAAAPPPPQSFDVPFAEFQDDDEAPVRRRRRGASVVLFFALLFLVMAGAGFGIVFLKFGGRLTGPVPAAPTSNTTESEPVATLHELSDSRTPATETVERSVPFPRRALLISVHGYLFANPVGFGLPMKNARNVGGLPDKLCNGLRIPHNQIVQLSDAAGRGQSHAPLKSVIEGTLAKFLSTSRPQDRILVLFAGHAVEVDGEAYLVPLEGELDRPDSLIPLKKVLGDLAACPARQKVFVLDVCRLNPVTGAERPGGEAMGPKVAEAIQSPPPGVQIWSACGAGQHSYETENDMMGVFLDELQTSLEMASEGKLQLQDHIQKPDDVLPVERLKQSVDELMAKELVPRKLEQQTMLTGRPAEGGAAYDPSQPAPERPILAAAPPPLAPDKVDRLRKLLLDVAVPPVKSSMYDSGIDFQYLATFDEKKLEPYLAEPGEETDLRKAVRRAQALLFAASAAPVPARLSEDVKNARKTLKRDLSVLRDGYRAPGNETQFKNQVMNNEREIAPILRRLSDAHEDLVGLSDKRDAEPKRWQANYDFMTARLEEEIAYLYEYLFMLGQMRKELPPLDRKLYNGWKLAATPGLNGDSTGKRMASSSRKILDKIIKDHAGTPWEVLAKREKLTALGLEWKPAK
jgi:hypothetical protein